MLFLQKSIQWIVFLTTRLFDKAYYLRHYPEVKAWRFGARLHYLVCGCKEQRQPNERFDPAYYNHRYPDVPPSNYSPLLHYILFGAKEGRQTSEGCTPDSHHALRTELHRRQTQRQRIDDMLASTSSPVLLVVDRYLPRYDQDAGGRSTFHYVQFFINRGMCVLFLPDDFEALEPYARELEDMGVGLLFGDWFKTNWASWLEEHGKQIAFAFLNRPDISIKYLDVLRKKTRARLLYYGHDIHYLRLERMCEHNHNPVYQEQARMFQRWEHTLWSEVDAIYYPSSVEVALVKQWKSTLTARAIPLFLYENLEPSLTLPSYEERSGLLFVGGFAHAPNADGVEWFCANILPDIQKTLPDILFHLVGGNPPASVTRYESDAFICHGWVTEETLQQLYQRVRIVVVPLRFGAGVKGKIVEALRWGTCMVSTSIGAEGMPGISNCVEVVDDPATFAKRLIALYRDPTMLEQRAEKGYQYLQNHFSFHEAERILGADLEE